MGIRVSRLAAAACAGAALALAPAASAQDDWTVKWSNGHRIDSKDKKFSLKFGGRIQADYTFVSEDPALTADVLGDGFEFRRSRLVFEGTVYERIRFKAEYDFVGGDPDFNDVFIGITSDAGFLQFGHFKEPFSFEGLTSAQWLPFVERALPIEAFWPARNSGVGFSGGGDVVNYGVGAFYDADDFGISVNEDDQNLTGRVAFRPLYGEDGARVINLGVSATHKQRASSIRFSTRPEAHFSGRFVDTGSFAADSATILGGEFVAIAGPFWAVAEYVAADVDAPAAGDPSFDGAYVSAGWFFTGEHRPFRANPGVFERVIPATHFGAGGSSGAWEIAGRWSTIDLTDAGIAGGEQENYTIALNWYLNPVTRLALDWMHADVDQVGEADFIVLRWQIDF
jgi:phosphate-selective porin OprO/OprP